MLKGDLMTKYESLKEKIDEMEAKMESMDQCITIIKSPINICPLIYRPPWAMLNSSELTS